MKYKVALNTFIVLLLGVLLFTQLNVVTVLAVANNPITSAIINTVNAITNQESTPSAISTTTSDYHVKPYLVYPADKSIYPSYETAVNSYLVELQNWYQNQVGKTFILEPLKVVQSSYTYNSMRCDSNPYDSIPASIDCLNDPKKMDGNWGTYMNLAIHKEQEK